MDLVESPSWDSCNSQCRSSYSVRKGWRRVLSDILKASYVIVLVSAMPELFSPGVSFDCQTKLPYGSYPFQIFHRASQVSSDGASLSSRVAQILPLFRQEFVEQSQPWPHHRAPFVMAEAVLYTDGVRRQPFLDHRRIDVVVVGPAFVSSVVRRVNENAVHLAGVERQERFQRVQVIAMDDQVAVERGSADAFIRVQSPGAGTAPRGDDCRRTLYP